MQHNSFFATALTALLVLVLSGCSNPDGKYSKVEGTITYNGQSVDGATVSFQPVAPDGESASGLTDASGKFKLSSVGAVDGGRGALPGEYRVTVVKREAPPPDPDQAAFDRGEIDYNQLQERLSRKNPYASTGGGKTKSLIPEKYATASSSGLTATVVKGKNAPVFELAD
jgi:hypothetical protein